MTQAAKTFSFLESLKFPLSTDVWMSVVRHRAEENNAYERYRIISEDLFKSLRPVTEKPPIP
jgi:hypothetical protein